MNPFLPIPSSALQDPHLLRTSGRPGWVGRCWLLALLLTGLSSVGHGQCFNSTTVSLGYTGSPASTPRSVVVGDFNGDGKADLATANAGSNNVSVLLGTGGGSFGPPTNFGVDGGPYSVAVADFNGDGKADLAVAKVNANRVSVLLGNGSGGFGAPTDFGVGSGPNFIVVADFNGDGKADVVTANGGSNDITVLLGNGGGGFLPPPSFPVGSRPVSMAVADFDGDGKLDLVTANSNSTASVSRLLGDGAGGFGPPTIFTPVRGLSSASIAVGDFNGDGKPDLATANYLAISVMLNDGRGNFINGRTLGGDRGDGTSVRPISVTVGDFNSDGKLDLATGNEYSSRIPLESDSVSVRLGDGTGFSSSSGGFGPPTAFAAGRAPGSIAVADFNGDGQPDLATANSGSNNVSVFINCATPTPPLPTPPFSITGVTAVSCTTVTATERRLTFTPQYAGLNAQPVSFSVANEMLPTNAPGPYSLRLYIDNPTITLKATQSGTPGEASSAYNWLAACTTGTPPPQVGGNGPACDNYTNRSVNGVQVNSVYAVGSTVYAATTGGLSISTDGGTTFTNKTTANGLGNDAVYNVYAVGSTVYAATVDGLSISTDGGNTFTNKTTANGLGRTNVHGVYVVGSTVYAATVGGGLSISNDGGNTFTSKTTANGLGDNTVNSVYVVGPTVYAATDRGLSISTDGGTTFTNKTTANGLGDNTVLGVYVVGSTVYAATLVGLSISTDGGTTFTNKTKANGLGNNLVLGVYAVGSTVYAATLGGLSISTDGGTTFTNKTTANGLGNNTVLGVYVVGSTVYAATLGGLSFCTSSTPSPFAITGATVNCQTVSTTERRVMLSPRYAGVTGQPVSFSVVNEMLPTTAPGPYTLRLYTDNPTITLKATQTGSPEEASFAYNWLAACGAGGSSRLGAGVELIATLHVKLLGNPVRNAVEIDVTGNEDRSLHLSLTDMLGRIVGERRTERAGATEHYQFDVSAQPAGILLLRVSTHNQSEIVRVLKVN